MNDTLSQWRMLVCHKHPLSTRLHFLVPLGKGVVLPRPLPGLCQFVDEAEEDGLYLHPAAALNELLAALALPPLQLLGDYQVRLEVPGGILPVYLAALPGNDMCASPEGTRWMAFTDCIGMPWLDRELLRRAYEVLIG